MSRNAPTIPTDASTAAFTTVSSSAGFSAGDLVYQKSGSVNPIPDGVVSSATFDITAATVQPGALGPSTAQQISTAVGVGGGAGAGFPNAAKLTNGNMVVVYCSLQNSTYYFRIIDENGTQVVAETSLGFTSVNAIYGQICVTALTGGGFAFAGINSSGGLSYGVYSNTGTVVTSATPDGTVSSSSGSLTIASRPDGSFIILMNDGTSTQTRFKVYSATGTQVIAWTNVVAYYLLQARCSVAVRSDNSFVISTWTSSTNIQYYVYSSAGSTSTNASVSSGVTPGSTYTRLDSTTLTNDSVVFAFNDNTNTGYFRILTSANSLGSLQSNGATCYTTGVKSLASGSFILLYENASYNNVVYSIRNSTGTQTASGLTYGVSVAGGARSSNYSTVQMASNIAVVGSWTYPASGGNGNTGFQSMFQIVTSTYAIRNFTTTSLVAGTASSSVNTYARSNSTPNAAAFLASTSTTLSKSIAQQSSSSASYVVAPTLVESAACSGVYVRTMQNGQIVIAYTMTASPYAVKFAVYSPSGVYLNTYTVSTSSYSSSIVKCCVLTNGNLVVVYMPTAGTSFTFVVYSPSFVVQSTTTFTPSSTPYGGAAFGPDISPMTNARFVFSYYNGATPTWVVFDSSVTQLATSGLSTAYNTGMSVAGMSNNGFVTVTHQNGGSSQVIWFQNDSGASFNQMQSQTFGTSTNQVGAPSISASPTGTIVTYFTSGGSGGYLYLVSPGTSYSSMFTASTVGATNIYGSTVMPDGSFVCVMLDNSTYYGWAQITPGQSIASGSNNPFKSSTLNMTGALPYSSSSNPSVNVAALFDNQFVVVYRDTSTYPRFFISSTTAGTYSTTTVSGTTVSNPAYFPSQSNGYILKGVATTGATAGGTGVVQTNGPAQLNSQYPSGTTYQAFDSTGTLIQGTKGTIVGRNVTLTGGV